MKATIISPGVIHFTTTRQYELSSAFMRMQEFYESATGLRGTYFTLEQCMDSYAAHTKNKEFTYTSDWAGFNVPGHIVDEFFKVFKGKLLDKEKSLLRLLQLERKKPEASHNDKYYIIGTYECLDASGYIYHELCHAFWYMYPEFKRASSKLLKQLPSKFTKSLNESLIRDGYDKSVLADERNAYMATSDMHTIRDYIMDEYDCKKFPWDEIYELQRNFYEFHTEVDGIDD